MTTVKQTNYILKKMADSWECRAQVKQSSLPFEFDPAADDFLIELLPFKNHPSFQRVDEAMRSKILSCGWIIYNSKTCVIENNIILPTCSNLISGNWITLTEPYTKQILAQTMVDESYHLLLVVNAINLIKQKRRLEINVAPFNLLKAMKSLQQKYRFAWQHELIQFATAIVSELYISDYLKLICDSDSIQAINRWSVAIHLEDELAHKNIFYNLTKSIYTQLSPRQRLFFGEIFYSPIRWFADVEWEIWENVLLQIKFADAKVMIEECKTSARRNDDFFKQHESLYNLAQELDIASKLIPLNQQR